MTFKTYEERRQAAEKMCEEGKGFQQLFQKAPFNKRVCLYYYYYSKLFRFLFS